MLRLAHRLLWKTVLLEPTEFNRACRDHLLSLLPSAQIIVIDNIAEYVLAHLNTPAMLSKLIDGNPCLPPFKSLFLEYAVPKELFTQKTPVTHRGTMCGALLVDITAYRDTVYELMAPCDLPFDRDTARWIYRLTSTSTDASGKSGVYPVIATLFFGDEGYFLGASVEADRPEIKNHTISVLNYIRLALVFAHCKNVSKVDVTDTTGPTKKWCRRMRVPELKYHALQIDPNLSAKPRVASAAGGEDHSGKALHICRGHFRTYAEGGPGLFGSGRTGTFWVPSHTRGSSEHGQVTKDYTIGVPAA